MRVSCYLCLMVLATLGLGFIAISTLAATVPAEPNSPPVIEPNEPLGPFDPNDPNTYQVVKVRLLTAEEEMALRVLNVTLEQIVGHHVERELPRAIIMAKRKLTEQKTLTELKAAIDSERVLTK